MVKFSIQKSNVMDVPSDLLLLKYAQGFYGADKAVKDLLVSAKVCLTAELQPARGDYSLVATKGIIAPKNIMFLGTPRLQSFTYDKMEEFAFSAIEKIALTDLSIRKITTTVHGIGYGLDGGEALQRLVNGFKKGLSKFVTKIEKITFLTLEDRSERILRAALRACQPPKDQATEITHPDDLIPDVNQKGGMTDSKFVDDDATIILPKSSVIRIDSKHRVFVAMPFSDEFENVYDFGIYPAVRNSGCICERVDEAHFTGDVLGRIREGIETSDLVIADLTGGRPNVYLEVGYAWGKSIPVIFVARNGEELHFDVRTHRCIFYGRFKQFAKELEELIKGIFGSTLK
ncbi:MAG: hypothetical protein V2J65_17515 [Desulfobacteraceae bacterium]|nr:hypothetical protein [Desulfobacteraceae bacterium]